MGQRVGRKGKDHCGAPKDTGDCQADDVHSAPVSGLVERDLSATILIDQHAPYCCHHKQGGKPTDQHLMRDVAPQQQDQRGPIDSGDGDADGRLFIGQVDQFGLDVG